MTLYDLKPKFQNMLRPLSSGLVRAGVMPNHVTALAMILSLGLGGVLWAFHEARWVFALVPALLFIRMALNALDGMMAREHNMQTQIGGAFNELSDMASDAAIYLPFGLVAGASMPLAAVAVIMALLTEAAGLATAVEGRMRRYDGPMGKSDRALAYAIAGLAVAITPMGGQWLNVLFGGVAALCALTVWNRLRHLR